MTEFYERGWTEEGHSKKGKHHDPSQRKEVVATLRSSRWSERKKVGLGGEMGGKGAAEGPWGPTWDAPEFHSALGYPYCPRGTTGHAARRVTGPDQGVLSLQVYF